MRLCVAQIKPLKGDIPGNIKIHLKWIMQAVAKRGDLLVFPELSLTGYEPGLAREVATDAEDPRFTVFQEISDQENITICVGAPTQGNTGIQISMLIFQPGQAPITYSKQYLHIDELPYFTEGSDQKIMGIGGLKIAPAICYESLLSEHALNARQLGANIYMASVAKSESGVKKAIEYFPKLAQLYTMPVLMANCIGHCDDFEAAGRSSIWDQNGTLIGKMNEATEGVLVWDSSRRKQV